MNLVSLLHASVVRFNAGHFLRDTLREKNFAGINFHKFGFIGFTEDFAGINFRELSLSKDFAGINFRESALFDDFAGVNITLPLGTFFPRP